MILLEDERRVKQPTAKNRVPQNRRQQGIGGFGVCDINVGWRRRVGAATARERMPA
jgi:hypothetical protein